MYTLIVVDYNSFETTAAYLDHCRQMLGVSGASHVVLVQNGDDCLAQMTARYGAGTPVQIPEVSQPVLRFENGEQAILYCHSGENMGYARGNNLGALIARSYWTDPYYIISNNDLVFEQPLDLTVADRLFSQQPSVALIGPRIISPDKQNQSPNRWRDPFTRLIKFYWVRMAATFVPGEKKSRLLSGFSDTITDAPDGLCHWVSGCFFFVRADAFHKVGMFDEHTFLYAEEMILSRRMEQAGYGVWFCRDLPVIHNHAQTTKKNISLMKSRQIEFESVLYYYKTYTKTSFLLLTLAKWNFALYKLLFTAVGKLRGR